MEVLTFHGEFIEWVNSLGMDRREAYKFMRVAEELPNDSTFSHLGNSALYLVATLPEEERTKEHATSNGETKTPDEMTVRELQELKKQLKEKEKQIQKKDEQIDNLADVINDMSVSQPRVVEKEVIVEKVPDDYESLKRSFSELEERSNTLQDNYQSLLAEREEVNKKSADT